MSFKPAYRYITAEELAQLVKTKPTSEAKQYAVVDVRSDDFRGGNIVDCINSPAETFHADVPELVKRLETDCALSQQRGPKAARIYAETRSELLGSSDTAQEVLVLRDGFTGFQQRYRNDPELIEKFNKYYHD